VTSTTIIACITACSTTAALCYLVVFTSDGLPDLGGGLGVGHELAERGEGAGEDEEFALAVGVDERERELRRFAAGDGLAPDEGLDERREVEDELDVDSLWLSALLWDALDGDWHSCSAWSNQH
jgi:hypothetical protein